MTPLNFLKSLPFLYVNILSPFINIYTVPHFSDSRLHFKNDDDNPADKLVSAEALPINQKKEKRRYSGVRMKGQKPIPSSEVASSKTLKPGKASVISSVPEENQDPQPSITKTPRRKQKMQVSKVRRALFLLML